MNKCVCGHEETSHLRYSGTKCLDQACNCQRFHKKATDEYVAHLEQERDRAVADAREMFAQLEGCVPSAISIGAPKEIQTRAANEHLDILNKFREQYGNTHQKQT